MTAGFDAFLADILDDRHHRLGVHRDHCERQFPGHIEDAGIRFQSENFRPSGIDRHDLRYVEAHVLQIFENVDGVVIAVAGADDGETIGFEKRR